MPPDRARLAAFGILVVGAILVVVVYARYFRVRAERVSGIHVAVVDDSARLEAIRSRPHVLFRNTALGDAYGRIAAVPLGAPGRSGTPPPSVATGSTRRVRQGSASLPRGASSRPTPLRRSTGTFR